jgi:hypothetical protein
LIQRLTLVRSDGKKPREWRQNITFSHLKRFVSLLSSFKISIQAQQDLSVIIRGIIDFGAK